MQVNKLMGDLHKQLLQQGKQQSHIGFSFALLLFELPGPKALEMSMLHARILKAQLLNPALKNRDKVACKDLLPYGNQSDCGRASFCGFRDQLPKHQRRQKHLSLKVWKKRKETIGRKRV